MIHQISIEEALKPKTADTSKESFEKLKGTLGERQKKVFNLIYSIPGLSNREISEKLLIAINSITPRVKELRDLGLVFELSKKYDETTERNVKIWAAYDI